MDDQKDSIYSSKDISTDDSLYETINLPEQPTTSPILINSEAWSTSVYDLSDSENEIDVDITKKRTSSIDFLMGSASSQADSDKESVGGKIYRHRRPGSLYKVEIDKDSSDNLEALESKYKPSSGFNGNYLTFIGNTYDT